MGVNSGAGTVSPSRIHEFTLAFFVGSCCSSFGFRCTYCFVDHSLTLRDFSFVHCIVYPSDCRSLFVPWSFFFCPNRRTNNNIDKRKKNKEQTMIYKQKNKQYNGQKKKYQGTNNDLQTEGQTIQWTKKKTKGQTMIYKISHRKLKIEQHEPTKNRG
jgi:hypothetical protein